VSNELTEWADFPNFRLSEFRCQCGCGRDHISLDLVRRLQEVRDLLGEPITITSGVRCKKHNGSIGGSDTSSHVDGWAADVKCGNSASRYKLLKAVMRVFDRVGIGNDGFLHLDIDPTKNSELVWLY